MPDHNLAQPVRYSANLEDFSLDDPQTIDGLNEAFHQVQQTVVNDSGHALRAVHAKAHGILQGELRVDEGLSDELMQGLFATPGSHRVVMRFSTNAGDVLHDSIGLPRGLAIKVFDVDGERLPDAEGRTQDFIMVNGPVFQVATPDRFLANVKLLAKTTDRAEWAKRALSFTLKGANAALTAVGLESPKLENLGGAPNVHPLGETFFGVTPFRYGEHVAKFQLVPVSEGLTRFTGRTIDTSGRPDAIREDFAADMVTTDGVWELRVQLLRDAEKQPVEDPTVEWPEDTSPFLRVGTIHAPPQDGWNPVLVREVDEGMRFSVWTGLAAHQPLGSINRARKTPYRAAADYRGQVNRCPLHEPTGERIDA